MNEALELIGQCEDNATWPGYGEEIQVLNLPPYAYKAGAA
jgi:hypothetical protein